MMTDPIGDFLTRIRNAHMSRHNSMKCPSSKMKVRIANILKQEGYIADFKEDGDVKKVLTLELKYDADKKPVIEGLKRVSKPGLRVYRAAGDLPEVRGGLGMAVLSTSRGVMTDHAAREANVGGEIVCYVW